MLAADALIVETAGPRASLRRLRAAGSPSAVMRRAEGDPLPADVRLLNAVASLLWAVVVAAGIGALIFWAARWPVFTLRDIAIDGEVSRNSVATIRANAMPHLQGNFFTMDLDRTRRAFESVPWVRHATIRRVFPNRLEVLLEEHHPAALWGDERLVNEQGEVFEANLGEVEEDGLPLLRGPDGSSAAMLSMLHRLDPLMERLNGDSIESLHLSGRGSWRARLAGGADIEFGRGSEDEIHARAERFVRTVGQITDRYRFPLKYVDLRHADAYALKLENVSTEAAPPAKPRAPAARRPARAGNR